MAHLLRESAFNSFEKKITIKRERKFRVCYYTGCEFEYLNGTLIITRIIFFGYRDCF